MKHLVWISAAFLLVACSEGNDQSAEQTETKTIEETVEVKMTSHGEEITEDDAVSVNEFMTMFEGQDSLNVKMAADITEVCAKKGCWMTLDLGGEKSMMVRFKDYEFFVPKDAAGKTAIIDGVAKMDTISVDELKHYAEDKNASQEEIDAITEPEITYSFEATGVLIKEETTSSVEK